MRPKTTISLRKVDSSSRGKNIALSGGQQRAAQRGASDYIPTESAFIP